MKELQAPWGDTQVEAEIPGPETNPCLKFTDPHDADRFADALRVVLGLSWEKG